jgi:hypothetical protein
MIWHSSTAIGLTPGGSSTVNIYTQTIHRTTQITTNLEECGPCPIFASFTPAFALQLGKKHGKSSVRVAEEWQYTYYILPKHPHITKLKTHTHTHTHTYIHTLQNNIKPPQYKLKQTQHKIYPNENSHNINKYPQYKVTLMYRLLLSPRTSP